MSAVILTLLTACSAEPPASPARASAAMTEPCPARHLALLERRTSSSEVPTLERFDSSMRPCRGVELPTTLNPRVIYGLPDGSELLGVSHGFGGSLRRIMGEGALWEEPDDREFPYSIAPFGEGRVAVLWGDSSGSSFNADRVAVHATADGAEVDRWSGAQDPQAIAGSVDGSPDRLLRVVGGGLEGIRLEAGSTAPSTTGEPRIGRPAGGFRGRDAFARGGRAYEAGNHGVYFWRSGQPPGLVGPMPCNFPSVVGSPLPEESAIYVALTFDPSDPDAVFVVVEGQLRGGSDERSHLYRLDRRGGCALVHSVPAGRFGVSVSWAGY